MIEVDFSKCTNEQQFKMKYVKMLNTKYAFCIESEETVSGFPDVIVFKDKGEIPHTRNCILLEFKYSDKRGVIKFQPTQPNFYKLGLDNIEVVAYNAKSGNDYRFSTDELFDKDSPFYMNENREVNLCKADKMLVQTKKKK